jgi:hypothetical protein
MWNYYQGPPTIYLTGVMNWINQCLNCLEMRLTFYEVFLSVFGRFHLMHFERCTEILGGMGSNPSMILHGII